MFIEASGLANRLGGLTAKSSDGRAIGICSAVAVSPNAGANLLYTATRTIPTSGATGAITSTHANNGSAVWRSVLIGVEAG